MTAVTQRPETRQTDAPQAGDRFVAGAAAAVALVLVAVQVLAGEVIPPLAAFALIYIGVGIVVGRRRSRWALAAVIALTLVHLLGSIPFFAANLAHPESPTSFLAEVFVGLTVLTALVGAVGGLRGARPGGRRPLVVGACALAAAAVVVSVVAAAGVESDERQPGDVLVEAVRATFPDIEVSAGGSALWVDNQDPFHHTLVIEGADVRQVLPASTAVRVETELAPGTYRYLCDVPGHEQMEGEIVVR